LDGIIGNLMGGLGGAGGAQTIIQNFGGGDG